MPQQLPYDPYASHLPALCIILDRLGPWIQSILEVGSGFYSTPVFHSFASATWHIEHIVLESNHEWKERIGSLCEVEIRPFDVHVLPDDVVQRQWDLVFIDCLVEESRAKHALRLKDTSGAIVLHDSNPDWDKAYGYSEIIPLWKYSHHFKQTYPHTLVLTDSDDAWGALGLPT